MSVAAGAPPAEPTGVQAGEAPPWKRPATLIPLLPGGLLVALWLVFVPASGGYFPRSWYPAAIGAVLLFCAVAAGRRSVAPPSTAARRALIAFVALAAWAFVSMVWAGSPAAAWETADQLVLYAALAGIAALVPWTPGALAVVAGAWSLGVAALCAGRLVTWLGARDVLDFFSNDGRLNDPIGYPNATAALPAIALFPALLLSSLRSIPAYARALAFPVAVFLAEFLLLPASRGAVLGTLLALPVAIALAPDRLRLVVRLAVAAAILAPAAGSLIAFANAPNDGKAPGPPLHHAATWIATSLALALLAGALLAMLDGRVRGPRIPRRGIGAAAVVVALAVAAVCVVYGPRAVRYVHNAWTTHAAPSSGGAGRLLSLAPEERPDYARVSLHAIGKHPLIGLGAGNFGREYDAHRRFDKHSRYPHNLLLRAAGEGGLVGLALLLTLVVTVAVGMVRSRRRLDATGRAVLAAAAGMGAYFLLHGEFDWLEAFPALVGPVVGLSFGVLSLAAADDAPVRRRAWPRWSQRAALGLAGGVVGAVLVALAAPYLSVRYIDRARSTWSAAPTSAFDDLDRAARWNPLSQDPAVNQGALALQLGQYKRATRAFRRALAREKTWFPYLELALIEARSGRFAGAGQLLEQASRLDRADPLITVARLKLAHRERVDPEAVNAVARQTPLFTRPQIP